MPSSVSLGAHRTSGAALIREDSCSMGIGTSTSNTKTPSPIKARKETSIANPRGITRETYLTGKERGIASAKPPSSTIGSVGAAHINSASATSPSTNRTVRVLLATLIGVSRNLPRAELACQRAHGLASSILYRRHVLHCQCAATGVVLPVTFVISARFALSVSVAVQAKFACRGNPDRRTARGHHAH
jgi:hypothetical protein